MRCVKRGFTLLELVIVVVIIGILAATALPIMDKTVNKAKKSEAMAALGAIRTAERLYSADHNVYIAVATDGWGSTGPLASYIAYNDLSGKYFPPECYSVAANTGGFTATCNSSLSGRSSSNTLGNITMDDLGATTGY